MNKNDADNISLYINQSQFTHVITRFGISCEISNIKIFCRVGNLIVCWFNKYQSNKKSILHSQHNQVKPPSMTNDHRKNVLRKPWNDAVKFPLSTNNLNSTTFFSA